MTSKVRRLSAALVAGVSSWALLAGSSLGVGCGGTSPVPESAQQILAENGTDITDLATRAAGMTASMVLDQNASPKLETAKSIGLFYAPSACTTAEQTSGMPPGHLTIKFRRCDGPWGLSGLDGTVLLDPDLTKGDSSDLIVKSTDFRLGNSDVSFTATASIPTSSFDNPLRTMTWNATIGGKTPHGRDFQVTGNWTLTWVLGGSCVTIDGESTGNVDGAPVKTTAMKLARCSTPCPVSGTLTVSDASYADTLTTTFNGMNVVEFVGVSGSSPIQLACGL